ncbi:MAG: putative arylsulfatase family enzyme twin-arginine signal, partial [Acidimicrobiales bacterium]|nr:putative arylsulfatase family enzyme twin-arginine signal [Acidimicrobiales bacterium]
QLNGGNDALNTLVPSDGRYRDARPTLAIPEADLVALTGVTDWTLHPNLAPLTPYWDAGTAAFLPGIGFSDPNHSHFVSLDRWWRADDLTSSTGWLGRSVAPGALSPLYATALGSGAPLLRSDLYQAAVVIQPSTFAFPTALPETALQRLTQPVSADALHALAQASLTSTIASVDSFVSLLAPEASDDAGDTVTYREGGLDLVSGLDLAARLVTSDVGARIVVVSVGGFDTHSNQLATQGSLLDDLAKGIDGFMQKVAAAGAADRTLLVTTSEFGRRVAENARGGIDHGAGGMSMMFGGRVNGGIHGDVDLGDQLDGDVRPTLDPRTMYTACLDWLGLDPVATLGKRYDGVALLRT